MIIHWNSVRELDHRIRVATKLEIREIENGQGKVREFCKIF